MTAPCHPSCNGAHIGRIRVATRLDSVGSGEKIGVIRVDKRVAQLVEVPHVEGTLALLLVLSASRRVGLGLLMRRGR